MKKKSTVNQAALEKDLESLLEGVDPVSIVIAKDSLKVASELLGSTAKIVAHMAAGYALTTNNPATTKLFGDEVAAAVIQHRLETAAILIETAKKLNAKEQAILAKYKPVVEARQRKQDKQLTA